MSAIEWVWPLEIIIEPHVGDSLYIGDDDDGNPVFVEIEPEATHLFMGEIDGQSVWTK